MSDFLWAFRSLFRRSLLPSCAYVLSFGRPIPPIWRVSHRDFARWTAANFLYVPKWKLRYSRRQQPPSRRQISIETIEQAPTDRPFDSKFAVVSGKACTATHALTSCAKWKSAPSTPQGGIHYFGVCEFEPSAIARAEPQCFPAPVKGIDCARICY